MSIWASPLRKQFQGSFDHDESWKTDPYQKPSPLVRHSTCLVHRTRCRDKGPTRHLTLAAIDLKNRQVAALMRTDLERFQLFFGLINERQRSLTDCSPVLSAKGSSLWLAKRIIGLWGPISGVWLPLVRSTLERQVRWKNISSDFSIFVSMEETDSYQVFPYPGRHSFQEN